MARGRMDNGVRLRISPRATCAASSKMKNSEVKMCLTVYIGKNCTISHFYLSGATNCCDVMQITSSTCSTCKFHEVQLCFCGS